MRSKYFWLLTFVLIGGVTYNARRSALQSDFETTVHIPEAHAENTQANLTTPQISQAYPLIVTQPLAIELQLPDLSTYRRQVESHEGQGVPPVLLEFSVKIAELMNNAEKSPTVAAQTFETLKDCALKGDSVLIQARTICAVNAIRLGDAQGSKLHEQASALRGQLPPDLLRFTQAMGY